MFVWRHLINPVMVDWTGGSGTRSACNLNENASNANFENFKEPLLSSHPIPLIRNLSKQFSYSTKRIGPGICKSKFFIYFTHLSIQSILNHSFSKVSKPCIFWSQSPRIEISRKCYKTRKQNWKYDGNVRFLKFTNELQWCMFAGFTKLCS